MATEKKKPVRLVHYGKTIYLVGTEGSRNEIVTFSHIFMDGSQETVGLRLDTPYQVGGKDAAGKTIKDWVYESFLTSEYNNNRKKSRAEMEADENSVDQDGGAGVRDAKL